MQVITSGLDARASTLSAISLAPNRDLIWFRRMRFSLHILLNLLSKYLFLPTSQRDVNIGSQILFITSDQSQGQIQNLQQLVFNT